MLLLFLAVKELPAVPTNHRTGHLILRSAISGKKSAKVDSPSSPASTLTGAGAPVRAAESGSDSSEEESDSDSGGSFELSGSDDE